MVIYIIKKEEKNPALCFLKIDKNGNIAHGSPLYRNIILEIDNCVTMRQENVLKKAIDSILFVTDLKISEITAVCSDKNIFDIKTFLRTHWGYCER